MSRIITKLNKESLTTRLTLIIIGLTAGSGLLIPATYASFHPVTTGEIADNTIRSADIENSQIRSEDIGAGQVAYGDIANDAIKPNIQRVSEAEPIEGGSGKYVNADCPAGTILTGGGYSTASDNVEVFQNYPLDGNTWAVAGFNNHGSTGYTLVAYAICIGPMP